MHKFQPRARAGTARWEAPINQSPAATSARYEVKVEAIPITVRDGRTDLHSWTSLRVVDDAALQVQLVRVNGTRQRVLPVGCENRVRHDRGRRSDRSSTREQECPRV